MNLGFGMDTAAGDDDDVYMGQGKNRIPRVSYDKNKNDGDLSSIAIYQSYLDDDDENDDDDDNAATPFDSEQRQPKLDRCVHRPATLFDVTFILLAISMTKIQKMKKATTIGKMTRKIHLTWIFSMHRRNRPKRKPLLMCGSNRISSNKRSRMKTTMKNSNWNEN